ncbi:Zinc finger, RING-CH-type [Parasponia andersonii]|uniref:Zinc finger, RING-CH-type n=1 Tax=Parasponia andersonii TaxID=3476 RepID=A0A2P5A8E3_PARAD|nr:Zinc finger, RING-CH-type [Parasponia andersonii]
MSHVDLEQGNYRPSVAGSDVSADGSLCFSDADEGSCYSQFFSTTGGSYDEYSFGFVCDTEDGVVSDSRRASSVSDCSVRVESDSGVPEIKVHLAKVERDCRICHLGLESNSHESGAPIELGCSCKDDLAAAHKNCAEAWFKIKGNKTCEICQSIARNVAGASEIELAEQTANEPNSASAVSAVPSIPSSESRSFWHGHRFLNFLLACMVFAFVVSWLFHFNVPSS